MIETALIRPLAKSVLFGALTACTPAFAYDLMASYMLSSGRIILLYVTAIIFGISVAVILCASLLIGLPTTVFLRNRTLESSKVYVALGAMGGAILAFVLVPILLGAKDIIFAYALFVPLSAASGPVTAWTWWRSAPPLAVRSGRQQTADTTGS